VMEKCLERCTDRTKELYLAEMSDPERVRELMMDPFGNYVIQRALSVATHSQAIRLVEAMRPHLMAVPMTGPNGARNGGVRNTAGGRRIIAKICRRFPNFTLNPMGTQEELYSQNRGNHRYLNHHQQGMGAGGNVIGSLLQPQHLQPAPTQHQSFAAYAPMGAPLQFFAPPPDPSLASLSHLSNQQQSPPPQQQQHFQYGLGGGNGGYYNPFGDTNGGYPGM
jgi:Pumilio-family RNA binding repeat